jgi:hypothetical protein
LETISQASESRAAKTISGILQSGRPLTYIRSVEEQRVAKLLREVASNLFSAQLPVWTWSLTEGLLLDRQAAQPGTQAPRKAWDFIAVFS